MTLHIQRRGKGPALVLLHGWGFNSGVWHALSERLCQDFEVFAVDLPGCGFSPLGSYHFDDLIPQILAHLPEQFSLMGWSLGGLIAMQMALSAPKRVLKLISVASSPCFISESSWPGVSDQVLARFDQRLQYDVEKTLREFLLLQSGLGEEGRQLYKRLWPELKSALPHSKALSAGLNALKNQDLRLTLGELEPPALFLYGRLDAIVPRSVAGQVQAILPTSKYTVFQKAAHAPFLSHEELFIQRLRDFLL